VLTVAAAVWLVPVGAAIDEVNDRPAPLGLVGMTEGQILRISVASVHGFDPQPDPPRCEFRVGFADAEGNIIGDPHLFDLRPGASRSFDHLAIGDPNVRRYVRPIAVDLRPKADCPAVVSWELLDRDGLDEIIVYDSVAFTDPWLSN
jgi:hypothetical protein